jgi:hypothetical protein
MEIERDGCKDNLYVMSNNFSLEGKAMKGSVAQQLTV